MKYIYSVMYAVAMRFTGLLLWTQENRLSEKFYRKLGFDVVLSSDDMSVVKLGDLEVQLVNIREDEEFAHDMMSGDKGRGTYVYLRVADVDKEYERQTGLGLEPYSSPRNWPWGRREFVTKDPDGYKLCFWCPTDKTTSKVLT